MMMIYYLSLMDLTTAGLPMLIVVGLVVSVFAIGRAWGSIIAKLDALIVKIEHLENRLNVVDDHEVRIKMLENKTTKIEREQKQ